MITEIKGSDLPLEANMDFENKQDLIDFVREHFGIVLENDETHPLNQHPDLLYTFIPKNQRNSILYFFYKKKIKTNEHLHGKYWIYLKNIIK